MIYYWKVKIDNIEPVLIVYAHTAKECDKLVNAWIKKQKLSEDTRFVKGYSYCIKKDTPSDIVEQEFEFLKEYLC